MAPMTQKEIDEIMDDIIDDEEEVDEDDELDEDIAAAGLSALSSTIELLTIIGTGLEGATKKYVTGIVRGLNILYYEATEELDAMLDAQCGITDTK